MGTDEERIPSIEDAASRVWRQGAKRVGADDNLFNGTRRPMVRLARMLADAHYLLAHKKLKTPKVDYLRRSLVAVLKVCYGLTRLLEHELQNNSRRGDNDDLVRRKRR